jgi:hypothetical protein
MDYAMNLLERIKYISYKVRQHGVINSFYRVIEAIAKKQSHNSTTREVIPLYRLTIDSVNSVYGVQYSASPEDVCREAIISLDIKIEEFCFIDIGAGKGRVLQIASSFPFKRIIGVEFAAELVDCARENLKSCDRAEIACADAILYDYPNDNLVVYMYNPFEAPVMEKVIPRLSKIAKSHTVYLIYLQPTCADVVLKYGDAVTPICWITTFKLH